MLYTSMNPLTGDAGISPMILVLIIICAVIIVGCIIWTLLLNRKNSKIETTVITVNADDDSEPEQTVVENLPLTEENPTEPESTDPNV